MSERSLKILRRSVAGAFATALTISAAGTVYSVVEAKRLADAPVRAIPICPPSDMQIPERPFRSADYQPDMDADSFVQWAAQRTGAAVIDACHAPSTTFRTSGDTVTITATRSQHEIGGGIGTFTVSASFTEDKFGDITAMTGFSDNLTLKGKDANGPTQHLSYTAEQSQLGTWSVAYDLPGAVEKKLAADTTRKDTVDGAREAALIADAFEGGTIDPQEFFPLPKPPSVPLMPYNADPQIAA